MKMLQQSRKKKKTEFSDFSDIRPNHTTADKNNFYTINPKYKLTQFQLDKNVPPNIHIFITTNMATLYGKPFGTDFAFERFPDMVEIEDKSTYCCAINNSLNSKPIDEWCKDLITKQIINDKDNNQSVSSSSSPTKSPSTTKPSKKEILMI
jgi:hypothetical protein